MHLKLSRELLEDSMEVGEARQGLYCLQSNKIMGCAEGRDTYFKGVLT